MHRSTTVTLTARFALPEPARAGALAAKPIPIAQSQ